MTIFVKLGEQALNTARSLNAITLENEALISGTRVENIECEENALLGYTSRGVSIVLPDHLVRVVLFGFWLDEIQTVSFSASDNCSATSLVFEQVDFISQTDKRVVVTTRFPETPAGEFYRLCIKSRPKYKHLQAVYLQISEFGTRISTEVPPRQYYFALWIRITIVSCLLVLSGLFSGLNLGLMSLAPQELMLIQKSGSKAERQCAEVLLPVRARGNLLLCSLLIGNACIVCVSSAISILLDDLTSGYVALTASCVGIVVFGKIFPQSLCVKKDLSIGAYTIWITRFSMIATFPITYPISKCDYHLAMVQRIVSAEDSDPTYELVGVVTLEDIVEEIFHAEIVDETDAVMDNVNRTRQRGAQARDVSCLMDADEPSGVISAIKWLTTNQKAFDSDRISQSVIEKLVRQHYHRVELSYFLDMYGPKSVVPQTTKLYTKQEYSEKFMLILEGRALVTIGQVAVLCEDPDLRREVEELKRKLLMRDMELKKANNTLVLLTKKLVETNNEFNALAALYECEKRTVASYESVVEVLDERLRKERADFNAKARDVSCLMDADEPSRVISVQMQLVAMQWLTTYQKAFHSYRISQSVIEKLIRQHCHRLRNLLKMEDKSTQEMELCEASDLLRAAKEVKRKLLMRDVELKKANNGLVTWKKQFVEANNELNASAELHEYEKRTVASYESAVKVLNGMFRKERANYIAEFERICQKDGPPSVHRLPILRESTSHDEDVDFQEAHYVMALIDVLV
ncbi:hypothetical protein KIN20_013014 [Parelaphostrongylus tenuis]|uniref:CNNM transmembrane domain-containing protein n=1 Tax=Parelaphostrongylus tenuis TaxID=148309 RepID=A0AAD5MBI2_PARTN|nr:hypothetical protein KIN20_013014 [Parelaphostrongylus tenuis]